MFMVSFWHWLFYVDVKEIIDTNFYTFAQNSSKIVSERKCLVGEMFVTYRVDVYTLFAIMSGERTNLSA
jgi:hypothetical protein